MMSESEKNSTLEYERRGAVRPWRTRLEVEEFPGGRRFVDPAMTLWETTRNVLPLALFVLAVLVVIALALGSKLHAYDALGVVVLFVSFVSAIVLMAEYQMSSVPTVIEARPGVLRVSGAMIGEQEWERDEIRSIRAVNGWRSASLVIKVNNREFRIFERRGREEMHWLATQLRLILKAAG